MRLLIVVFFGVMAFSCIKPPKLPSSISCACNTLHTSQIVLNKNFNRINAFDTSTFDRGNFYHLDSVVNKTLWYRDVESPDTTKFTRLWNDYFPAGYHASHSDFVEHYDGMEGIELAFQMGPNADLWAYHIFVARKVNCCFLVTHSYFRHARFTAKFYAIVDAKKMDSLFGVIGRLPQTPIVSDSVTFDYSGYFMDNRNKRKFYLNFDKAVVLAGPDQMDFPLPKKEVTEFYQFLDKKIKWTQTL